jgi:DNA-binding LacI/PurR family transcriptional regulator
VLNNSAPVSLQARQQVREAVVRLGYVRHRAAPSTPRGRVRTVAAVVCTNHSRFFADAFFSQVIAAATDVLAAHDVPLTLLVAPDDRVAPIERYLHSGHVDGVILLASHGQHPLAVSLPAAGLPVTLIGRPMCATRASYVDADNLGGGRQAVQHLLSRGRSSIATIAGRQDMAVGADRLAGYRATLDAAGLPATVAYGDFTHAVGGARDVAAAGPAAGAGRGLRRQRHHGRRRPARAAPGRSPGARRRGRGRLRRPSAGPAHPAAR